MERASVTVLPSEGWSAILAHMLRRDILQQELWVTWADLAELTAASCRCCRHCVSEEDSDKALRAFCSLLTAAQSSLRSVVWKLAECGN